MTSKTSFFEMLGVPQVYMLEDAHYRTIKSRSRTLQRQYHPDRLKGATPKEQQLSAQFSAQINSAVQTLRDPVARAKHLLDLLGLPKPEEQYTVKDNAFLMQQMMHRESLEEAGYQRDLSELKRLSDEVINQFDQLQFQFAQLISSIDQTKVAMQGDMAGQAVELVAKMQFFQKLSEEINSAITVLS